MTGLPHGWAWARLDEVAEVRLGRQRSPKNESGDRMRPYLRAANVTWRGLDLSEVKEMNFSESESRIYELRDGDVLVAESSGSADEVGRPALWRGEIDECCFQNHLIRVRSRGVLPEYLRYFLLAEARLGRIGQAAPGIGIHHIGSTRLAAWSIAIAPVPEQRRIVAAIEKQLSRLDAATVNLSALRRRISALEAAVFHAAFDSARAAGAEEPLQDLVQDARVGLDRRRAEQSVDPAGRVPYVRMQDINSTGVLEWTQVVYVLASAQERERFELRAGDLLFNTRNSRELVGKTAAVTDPPEAAVFNNNLMRIRLKDGVDPSFVWTMFQSPRMKRALDEVKRTTTNVAAIYAKDLLPLRLPVPDLAIQKHLAELVGQQLSLTRSLMASASCAADRTDALRLRILDSAFSGELVPQDPSDEPASILLERVAAKRAATPRPTRKRGATASA